MSMNGYELVSRVLSASAFSCDALIDLAGNQETEWLEFKAALYPPAHDATTPHKAGTKENEADYFWHVAKAVLALANSAGGAVLLGVSDNAEPVDLGLSDPKGFLQTSYDDYFRQTLDKAILPSNRKWNTGTQGIWTIDLLPSHLIESHRATLKGQPVIAILVKASKQLIKSVELVNGNAHRSIVMCRQSGQMGRVREIIDHDQIHEFAANRLVENPIVEGIWSRFSASQPQLVALSEQKKTESESILQQLQVEMERIRAIQSKWVRTSSKGKAKSSSQRPVRHSANETAPGEIPDQIIVDGEFVKKFRLFVDTDVLLHPKAHVFLVDQVLPLLSAQQEQLLISERSVNFLNKASTNPIRQLVKQSYHGLKILQQLQQAGCVTDCKDPYPILGDPFATDTLFKDLFVKYLLESPMCMLTQNENLAHALLANANSAAFHNTRPIAVLYLDSEGVTHNWQTKLNEGTPFRADKAVHAHPLEDEIAQHYNIYVDTSSLMLYYEEAKEFSGKTFFINSLLPLLKKYQHSLTVPLHVTEELLKHQRGKDPLRAQQAKAGDDVLQAYLASKLLLIGNEEHETASGSSFADQVFVRLAIRFASDFDLCFITQDRELARTLLANQPAVGTGSHKFKVAYISPHNGKLGDWNNRLAREIKTAAFEEKQISHYEPNRSNPKRGDIPPHNNASSHKIMEPFAICERPHTLENTVLPCSGLATEGDWITTKRFGRVQLGKEIASGGEGTIFATSHNSLVCKIYFTDFLTLTRKSKLELMLSKQINLRNVCWPEDIAFNANNEFVGYLMPQARGKTLKRSVFAKPLLDRNFPDWKRVNLHNLTINILKMFDQLHRLNILIGDINPENILVFSDREFYIVDTDSFQIEGFPCPVGTDTFTPPERQNRNFNHFLRTLDDELFAVATLVFMILFPGKAPYAAQGGGETAENIKNRIFPYVQQEDGGKNIKPVGSWQFIWSHLYPSLKDDFIRVFHKGHRVPIRDLLNHLYASVRDIEADKRSNAILPDQPRMKDGDTVRAICEICGVSTEIGKSLALNLATEGRNFRHSECSAQKKLERIENTREVNCTSCGVQNAVPNKHLENLKSSNRRYLCNNCKPNRTQHVRRHTPYYQPQSNTQDTLIKWTVRLIVVALVVVLVRFFIK